MVFIEGGKTGEHREKPWSKDETHQQTKAMPGVSFGNQSKARHMEGDCSHKTEFLLHQSTFTYVPWKNMGPTLFPENHRILLAFAVILEISFVVCSYWSKSCFQSYQSWTCPHNGEYQSKGTVTKVCWGLIFPSHWSLFTDLCVTWTHAMILKDAFVVFGNDPVEIF